MTSRETELVSGFCRAVRGWLAALLCLLSVYAPLACADTAVTLVTHGANPAYDELIRAVRARPGLRVRVVNSAVETPAGLQVAVSGDARIVVPIGTKATEQVFAAGSPLPIHAVLVPKAAFASLQKQHDKAPRAALTALYLDQPPQRVLRLAQAIAPEAAVGLLTGPQSGWMQAALSSAARQHSVKLESEHISSNSELYAALPRLLERSQLLLPAADPEIYNLRSIEYLFLTAYQRHIPIVGMSASTVKAGAIAAVYSTPAQIGRQLAEQIEAWAAGDADALTTAYPDEFEITTNPQVARSLGITLPPEDKLMQRIRTQAGGRK